MRDIWGHCKVGTQLFPGATGGPLNQDPLEKKGSYNDESLDKVLEEYPGQ